jgi:signal transduction histidine kinase
MIEVDVTDSGPGIPDEIAGRLFEPFVSTKQDGMGLGLSISRSIIEAHDGQLIVEPSPGGGTSFRFTYPFR